jgi:hypothetical protein
MPARSFLQIAGPLLLTTALFACAAPPTPADDDRLGSDSDGMPPHPPAITTVIFAPTSELAKSQEKATLLLLGFRDADLDPRGMPGDIAKPAFEWRQPQQDVSWPFQSTISLPQDPTLHFFAVIDLDGAGRLSPGDHLSPGQQLPENSDSTMLFRVDRSLRARETGRTTPDSPKDSLSLSAAKNPADLSDPEGEAALISLDCNPRLPFLNRGSVLLVGYDPTDLVRERPQHEASPSYLWRSEPLALTWPIVLDIPTPSDVSLFIVLDVNGDGMPSRGELSTARVDPTPNEANPAMPRFTLDQVWWPGKRSSLNEASLGSEEREPSQ